MIKEFVEKRKVFIKYIISAGLSFLIDLILFKFFTVILKFFLIKNISIIFATIIARIISSLFNYLINRNHVFNNKVEKNKQFIDYATCIKYYALVLVQMLVSGTLVSYVYNIINLDEIFIKIPVDIIIFIVNYIIQKKFIFKRSEKI